MGTELGIFRLRNKTECPCICASHVKEPDDSIATVKGIAPRQASSASANSSPTSCIVINSAEQDFESQCNTYVSVASDSPFRRRLSLKRDIRHVHLEHFFDPFQSLSRVRE